MRKLKLYENIICIFFFVKKYEVYSYNKFFFKILNIYTRRRYRIYYVYIIYTNSVYTRIKKMQKIIYQHLVH